MSDLEMNDDASSDHSPEASNGDDLTSALGGGEVSFVTGAEENRTGFGIETLEHLAQFMGRRLIERLKQWYVTQALDIHWQESDGTVVTLTAMHRCEKRQINGETTLVEPQKLTWSC